MIRRCLALVAPLLVVACAAVPGDAADDAEASDAEIRASCTSPRRYYAAFPWGRSCDVVEGVGGRWVPEVAPVFGDAPASFATQACVLRWSAAAGTAPDAAALDRAVGYVGTVTPACGSAASPRHAEARPTSGRCDLCQGGAVGCDVCGLLGKNGRLWAILPPSDRIQHPKVIVRLSDGTERAFAIDGATGAAVVDLPSPPPGTHWIEGSVAVTE